ncbi:MAG TPA: HEAT repeat domain-containing protein [Tepidisphaeraceae bacterium]|nr:HEAT repeat domain-containing protein [Tepidisphaeraceae bacterium]
MALLSGAARAGAFADQAAHLDDPARFEAVVNAGESALPDVAAALTGARPDLAVAALGRMKLKQAASALTPLAGNEDGELRAAVAWALGECAAPDASATLEKLSADPYPPARVAAILSLAHLQTGNLETRLRTALADPDERVRRAAVQAVQAAGDKSLIPLLLPMLAYDVQQVPNPADKSAKPKMIDQVNWAEPSGSVRLAAIEALGKIKSVDALPALIDAMERAESFHRLAIIAAIKGTGPTAAPVCLGRIVPLPYDKEAFATRMPVLINNGTLAVIAGQLGDARCIDDLLDTLELPHATLGKDKDLTELYIQTVELLGHFRVDRAGHPIAAILKETRVSQLSEAAQTAIRAIGRPAARALARNMDAWEVAPIFLELLREPSLQTVAARDGIIKYLSHESDEVRLEATRTLGLYLFEGLLDEYDTPFLDAMYLDPSREVRVACAQWQQKLNHKPASEVQQ